jgi:alkylated DNA repair dioxygenase AlkB
VSPEYESLLGDRVRVHRGAFAPDRARIVFNELLRGTPWLVVRYENEGRPGELPRLTVNYGERSYDYSGLTFAPLPWTPLLAELKGYAEVLTGQTFNALIVQLYRDGRDRVNWHADDNPSVGVDPTIVSLSFGATRRFLLRPRRGGDELALTLNSGDVVVMRGDLQHTHVHRVPREPAVTEPRINLTFRAITGDAPQPRAPHTSTRVRWPVDE